MRQPARPRTRRTTVRGGHEAARQERRGAREIGDQRRGASGVGRHPPQPSIDARPRAASSAAASDPEPSGAPGRGRHTLMPVLVPGPEDRPHDEVHVRAQLASQQRGDDGRSDRRCRARCPRRAGACGGQSQLHGVRELLHVRGRLSAADIEYEARDAPDEVRGRRVGANPVDQEAGTSAFAGDVAETRERRRLVPGCRPG